MKGPCANGASAGNGPVGVRQNRLGVVLQVHYRFYP